MSDMLDTATAMAMEYHHCQVNKHNGEPYILHPHRVAILVRDKGLTAPYQATAWLHDALEDTELTFSQLMIAMPNSVAFAVRELTKVKGERLEEYYLRIRENQIARQVKIADMIDNVRRNHLLEDDEARIRMAKKYSLGFDILS